MSNTPQTVIHVNNQGSSALGMAGLIFSALGWLTCGLLCIPGTVLSFLGLFSSKPKGLAIAGLIVGFPGSLFFIFVGAGMLAAFFGVGAAVTGAVEAARIQAQAQSQQSMNQTPEEPATDAATESTAETQTPTPELPTAEVPSEAPSIPQASTPVTPAPTVMPAPEDVVPEVELKPLRRVFSDSSGKFRVDATVIGYKQGWLRLRRKDGGKDVSVEIKKLSEDDQAWVAENEERLQSLK